jgi:hypothetical protein
MPNLMTLADPSVPSTWRDLGAGFSTFTESVDSAVLADELGKYGRLSFVSVWLTNGTTAKRELRKGTTRWSLDLASRSWVL